MQATRSTLPWHLDVTGHGSTFRDPLAQNTKILNYRSDHPTAECSDGTSVGNNDTQSADVKGSNPIALSFHNTIKMPTHWAPIKASFCAVKSTPGTDTVANAAKDNAIAWIECITFDKETL